MIISASRREDIPAKRMDWFMEMLGEGRVLVPNPYDASKPRLVSLVPESVDCIVFWTRNAQPLLGRSKELELRGYSFFVQATITGYPKELEPGVPPKSEAVRALKLLSEAIGADRIVWRYDPLILAAAASGLGLDEGFHLRNFAALARELSGCARRLVFSALDDYRNTRKRLENSGYEACPSAPRGTMHPRYAALIKELAVIARAEGFEPQTCAEPPLGTEIIQGACVDGPLLGRLFGFSPEKKALRPGRPGCKCSPSVDIGRYGACAAGCVYCYARR